MANTVSIAALRAQLWQRELYEDAAKQIYFEQFIDRGSVRQEGLRTETAPKGIVQEITDLSKEAGNQITFGLSTKLSGDGTTGDDELEGNEEAITTYSETLSIDQKRHAVRSKGKFDDRIVKYNKRADAKDKLSIWLAENIQQDMFYKLNGRTDKTFANTPDAPAASRSVWAGGQTADGNLTASHKFDTKVIVKARQTAQVSSPRMRPIIVRGKRCYVMIVHPYQSADLKKDSVWNQAQRDAWWRGEENPIFTGALGVFDQVIIHEHEDIYQWAGGSGAANIARAALCAAQALIIAYGGPTEWVEQWKDYKNKWGIACGRIWGVVKPMFNSVDYAVVHCASAAAAATTS